MYKDHYKNLHIAAGFILHIWGGGSLEEYLLISTVGCA